MGAPVDQDKMVLRVQLHERIGQRGVKGNSAS
jgi:hypothetical protein